MIEDRQDEQHDERELPADDDQHDERDDEQQAGTDELQQPPLDQLAHALDVGRHPRHEHARLVAVEERHRLRLQAVEHADPQVAEEALAGLVDRHVLLPADEVVDDDDHAVGDDRRVQRGDAALAEPAVGREADDQRAGDGAQRRDDDEAERGEDPAAVRLRELERAAQDAAGLRAVEAILVADGASRPTSLLRLRPVWRRTRRSRRRRSSSASSSAASASDHAASTSP